MYRAEFRIGCINSCHKSSWIGEGDEIIVPANTYIATVIGITNNKATPIFVEPDEFYNIDPFKIEKSY